MWYVYLLECSDNSYYCGITNNLEKRIQCHNKGKASRYTRCRLPVKLIAQKIVASKGDALRLEYRVKQIPRDKKIMYLE